MTMTATARDLLSPHRNAYPQKDTATAILQNDQTAVQTGGEVHLTAHRTSAYGVRMRGTWIVLVTSTAIASALPAHAETVPDATASSEIHTACSASSAALKQYGGRTEKYDPEYLLRVIIEYAPAQQLLHLQGIAGGPIDQAGGSRDALFAGDAGTYYPIAAYKVDPRRQRTVLSWLQAPNATHLLEPGKFENGFSFELTVNTLIAACTFRPGAYPWDKTHSATGTTWASQGARNGTVYTADAAGRMISVRIWTTGASDYTETYSFNPPTLTVPTHAVQSADWTRAWSMLTMPANVTSALRDVAKHLNKPGHTSVAALRKGTRKKLGTLTLDGAVSSKSVRRGIRVTFTNPYTQHRTVWSALIDKDGRATVRKSQQ